MKKLTGWHTSVLSALGFGPDELRKYLRTTFFEHHIKRYSKSRRKAPIYWKLTTLSASYSIWLYYHAFTKDTFFRILNDYVTPKLQHEEAKLFSKQKEVGTSQSKKNRKEISLLQTFVDELRTFKEEVARIAPLWNPNLNDGVIINFAPLWRLVQQHKSWQKECKACWDKLCKGEYDWAHLAMHLWPERVVPKCLKDRSLAIAHSLEDEFWSEDEKGKWNLKNVEPPRVDELITERTSSAVKAALNDLLNAPVPSSGQNKRKGARRRYT